MRFVCCLLLTSTADVSGDDLGDVLVFCADTNDPDTFEFFADNDGEDTCLLAGGRQWEIRLSIHRKRGSKMEYRYPDAYFHPGKISNLTHIAESLGHEVKLLKVPRRGHGVLFRPAKQRIPYNGKIKKIIEPAGMQTL